MDRRTFLGELSGTIGILSGCLTTTHQGSQETTSGPNTCYNMDGERYPCHNHDRNADFDSFYVRAWTGDEYNIQEMGQSDDIFTDWDWYTASYGWHGVRGTVTNYTSERIPALEITMMTHRLDEDTGEHHIISHGTDYIFDIFPEAEYAYNVQAHTDWVGDASVFELWIDSAY